MRLAGWPARGWCTAAAPVRLLLLPAEEAEAWLRGRAYPLAATAGHARTGSLTHLASAPAELVLVMERQADPRSATRLRLTARLMDPSLPFPAPATPADRRRERRAGLGLARAVCGRRRLIGGAHPPQLAPPGPRLTPGARQRQSRQRTRVTLKSFPCCGPALSFQPCVKRPPKRRSSATGCCCAPATSASSARAFTITSTLRSARC